MYAGGSSQAETTSYTVTATIEPAGALQKADWSLAWANGSSSWASGKTVTDYVTVSTSEGGGLTATVTLVKPFSEQIILTAAARGKFFQDGYLHGGLSAEARRE